MKRCQVLPLLALLLLSACSPVVHYPITTGGRVPVKHRVPERAYVVWANHPGAGQYVTGQILQSNVAVVERARLDELLAEQQLTLALTRDEDILRVGHLAGASHVAFVEVRGADPPRYGEPPIPLQVVIRSVAVESGQVQWSGQAFFQSDPDNRAHGVLYLTQVAMQHALCDGVWEEPSTSQEGGCQRGTTAGASPTREQPIWQELGRQEIIKEYDWLNAEKRSLEQQHSALLSERDPAVEQRARAEYDRRLAEYNRRLASYEGKRKELREMEGRK